MHRLPARCDVEYVVLAAGSSRRMGFAKAVTPLAGLSPLQRLALACGDRPVTVVTNRSLAMPCGRAMPRAKVIVNDDPELGMSGSMRVADASIRPEAIVGVLLADKPFVKAATLERCELALVAETCDVLVPHYRGEAGHPVYFGPAARALIKFAPSGDSLRTIRDDAALVRRTIACEDAGVIDDLDTPETWFAARRRLREVRDA